MEIKQIKAKLDIGTVLAYYGVKPDKNNMARCPFHDDKTPSLQIYPKSNTYCCFSSNCSAGTGDVIQFIELQEKQGKHRAILKAKALLGMPETENPVPSKKQAPKAEPPPSKPKPDYDRLFKKLRENIRKSERAQDYLKSRNLDPGKPEVGYNSSTMAELKDCIIFPLKDKAGKVVSLYGRSIRKAADTEETGKHYYTKDRSGLYPHYPPIETRKLILTESVIDAATLLQQEEITTEYEILALYGTNGLTEEHKAAIKELENLKEIILWMDGDGAGEKAAEKYREAIYKQVNTQQSW